MPRIQGVGPRLAARIVEMGLVQPNGKPDVRAFVGKFPWYDKTLVYEWVADRRTPTKEVARLCADLQLTHGYLLYGEGEASPYMDVIAGGSAGIEPPPVAPASVDPAEDPLGVEGEEAGTAIMSSQPGRTRGAVRYLALIYLAPGQREALRRYERQVLPVFPNPPRVVAHPLLPQARTVDYGVLGLVA